MGRYAQALRRGSTPGNSGFPFPAPDAPRLTDNGGGVVTAEWDIPTNPALVGVVFQVALAADGPWTDADNTDAAEGTIELNLDVETDYWIRFRWTDGADPLSDWSPASHIFTS